jgi:hypothetical protein
MRGVARASGVDCGIIYFWWERGSQFWLFALYDKDELEDLSAKEKRSLKVMLEAEQEARS